MVVSRSTETPYTTIFTNGSRESACDTTLDKGGSGSGFRPHDLLEAAFACCLNMHLRMYADKHKIPLEEVKITVSLNREHPEQTIFEYRIGLHGDLTAEQRQELMQQGTSCAVSKTLSKKISFLGMTSAPSSE